MSGRWRWATLAGLMLLAACERKADKPIKPVIIPMPVPPPLPDHRALPECDRKPFRFDPDRTLSVDEFAGLTKEERSEPLVIDGRVGRATLSWRDFDYENTIYSNPGDPGSWIGLGLVSARAPETGKTVAGVVWFRDAVAYSGGAGEFLQREDGVELILRVAPDSSDPRGEILTCQARYRFKLGNDGVLYAEGSPVGSLRQNGRPAPAR